MRDATRLEREENVKKLVSASVNTTAMLDLNLISVMCYNENESPFDGNQINSSGEGKVEISQCKFKINFTFSSAIWLATLNSIKRTNHNGQRKGKKGNLKFVGVVQRLDNVDAGWAAVFQLQQCVKLVTVLVELFVFVNQLYKASSGT